MFWYYEVAFPILSTFSMQTSSRWCQRDIFVEILQFRLDLHQQLLLCKAKMWESLYNFIKLSRPNNEISVIMMQIWAIESRLLLQLFVTIRKFGTLIHDFFFHLLRILAGFELNEIGLKCVCRKYSCNH